MAFTIKLYRNAFCVALLSAVSFARPAATQDSSPAQGTQTYTGAYDPTWARQTNAIGKQADANDTTFAIGWKGRYRIEGPAFIYVDHDTGQLSTILGYPTHLLK